MVGERGSRLMMRVGRGVRVKAIDQRSRGNAWMTVVWAGDDFFAAALSHFYTAPLARSLRSLARGAVWPRWHAEGETFLDSSTRGRHGGLRTYSGEGQRGRSLGCISPHEAPTEGRKNRLWEISSGRGYTKNHFFRMVVSVSFTVTDTLPYLSGVLAAGMVVSGRKKFEMHFGGVCKLTLSHP